MAFGDYATLLDNFNRADNPAALGGSWTQGWLGVLGILSGQASRGAADWGDAWHASDFGPDCELHMEITSSVAGGELLLGMAKEIAAGTQDSYEAYWKQSSNTFELLRRTNGATASLGSDTSAGLAVGDRIGIERIGNRLRFMHKVGAGAWTELIAATDSNFTGNTWKVWLAINGTAPKVNEVWAGTIATAPRWVAPGIHGRGAGW